MVYMKRWRMGQVPRLVPRVGTQRRLQALMAIGYSHADFGRILGRSRNYTYELMAPDKLVTERTAGLIADLYDRLCMTPPTGGYASRTRKWAARQGFAPPLAWDDIDHDPAPAPAEDRYDEQSYDEAMVLRVLNGGERPRRMTNAEAAEVVRRMVAQGLTPKQIEALTRLKVERYYRAGDAA